MGFNNDSLPNINSKGIEVNTFDAIVIGSGMTGGWAAKEFCEKGLKTLVLERGRNVEHIKDYPTATLNPWQLKHRDTLTMTITATLAGAISMLGNFAFFLGGNRSNNNNPLGAIGVLVAMIVAPFAAMMVQMAISRTREYAADRRGAEICGQPL